MWKFVGLYYGDKVKASAIENNDDGNKINNNKTITSKYKKRAKQ